LLDLIQLLRGHRYPVTGAVLAQALGVSLRTLYRDIATLQAQGALIEGEPGLGYVLRPGFMLPPLMFSEEEIEALVLGSVWVSQRADPRLRDGAKSAVAKIAAVLPDDLRQTLENTAFLVPRIQDQAADGVSLADLRGAIRSERKVVLRYRDAKDEPSERVVWPFALAYFDHVRVLAAWCERRCDYRHFRTDRIVALEILACRYPRRRQVLLKEWRQRQGLPEGK
jgi:predicted DNA-binding transcriptional regulator YafY